MERNQAETTHGSIKRSREELEKETKEVKLEDKIKNCWGYLEKVKKLQELEISIEEIRKELKMAETKFPDLKSLRGNVEHLVSEKFWAVVIDDKIRRVPGKSYDVALEKYKKRLALEKTNQEKQKQKKANEKKD